MRLRRKHISYSESPTTKNPTISCLATTDTCSKISIAPSTITEISQKTLDTKTHSKHVNISSKQLKTYLSLFDDPFIKKFLQNDHCFLLSDKYLLMAALIVLVRAKFEPEMYRKKFLTALFLVVESLEESHYINHLYYWIKLV